MKLFTTVDVIGQGLPLADAKRCHYHAGTAALD